MDTLAGLFVNAMKQLGNGYEMNWNPASRNHLDINIGANNGFRMTEERHQMAVRIMQRHRALQSAFPTLEQPMIEMMSNGMAGLMPKTERHPLGGTLHWWFVPANHPSNGLCRN